MENKELTPVTDEELEQIIEEVGNEFLKELESAPDPEISKEEMKILTAETMEERIRLQNKYFGGFATSDIHIED